MNEKGADLESRVERRMRIWGTATRGPEKWDAEGFWAGGLDLGVWDVDRVKSPNAIKSDRLQVGVILHYYHLATVLGLGHSRFELGPLDLTSFAGAWHRCRLLTLPSDQSQKRSFPPWRPGDFSRLILFPFLASRQGLLTGGCLH